MATSPARSILVFGDLLRIQRRDSLPNVSATSSQSPAGYSPPRVLFPSAGASPLLSMGGSWVLFSATFNFQLQTFNPCSALSVFSVLFLSLSLRVLTLRRTLPRRQITRTREFPPLLLHFFLHFPHRRSQHAKPLLRRRALQSRQLPNLRHIAAVISRIIDRRLQQKCPPRQAFRLRRPKPRMPQNPRKRRFANLSFADMFVPVHAPAQRYLRVVH